MVENTDMDESIKALSTELEKSRHEHALEVDSLFSRSDIYETRSNSFFDVFPFPFRLRLMDLITISSSL
jgi:hypothetical protein